ncbi:hypothetical protein SDC9_175314 [bioreactor metagenome]|uniref:Uncharacterized protein n=1 Tax=bioreactor metagenome TaxID=1076179 RepID=A0A645GNV7_9ZZZZ
MDHDIRSARIGQGGSLRPVQRSQAFLQRVRVQIVELLHSCSLPLRFAARYVGGGMEFCCQRSFLPSNTCSSVAGFSRMRRPVALAIAFAIAAATASVAGSPTLFAP